jgi:hypothetical protein
MKEQTGKTSSTPSSATRAREALLARILPAPVFVRLDYKRRTGKALNLQDPQTFNEKLQWLKLNNRDPKLSEFVDKYRVKDFVTRTVGSEYVLPTAALFERADDIKLSELPEKCILKATHGSAWNIIIRDKGRVDERKIQRFFQKRLSANYYTHSREWPYKNVKPRVLCEELLVAKSGALPMDYKIWCFNGSPEYIAVDVDRFEDHKRAIFDFNWSRQDFSSARPFSKVDIPRPRALDEFSDLARALSSVAPFVRVDLLLHEDRPYVGELTLYPGSGMSKFFPESADQRIGRKLRLDLSATKSSTSKLLVS